MTYPLPKRFGKVDLVWVVLFYVLFCTEFEACRYVKDDVVWKNT